MFRWEFCGIFSGRQNKGPNILGNFRSIFRQKFRSSKTIFRANFVLQTCHPKKMCLLETVENNLDLHNSPSKTLVGGSLEIFHSLRAPQKGPGNWCRETIVEKHV